MTLVSYEQFGVNFIACAVTPERVRDAVAEVAGPTIELAPFRAGPAGAARVRVEGVIGDITAKRDTEVDLLAYRVTVPVRLHLEIRVAGQRSDYDGDVVVHLRVVTRTVEPLSLVFDVERIRRRDIAVDLRTSGMAARVLRAVGTIDAQVRRQVARFVNERLESEEAANVRTIDVREMIDDMWRTRLGRSSQTSEPVPDGMAGTRDG